MERQGESATRGQSHRSGSRRNPDIDTAVLTAARELLAECGYSGTSIDAIASRAGVGRPAIYRRWRTKAHIVHDAIYPSIAPPAAANLLEGVETLVSGAYALFGSPAARAGVPGLISDTRADEELRKRLVDEQLDPVREAVGRLLAEGLGDGATRPEIDADTIVDVVAGAAIFALSVRDAEGGAELASRVTDLLLYGLLARD